VKGFITKSNPMMGTIDRTGDNQLYKFTFDLRRKVDEYRKAGKDPRDLMDPSKPDYMGSPGALAGYQKTLQQSSQDIVETLRRQTIDTINEGRVAAGLPDPPARNDVMPAIPPADQRSPGSIYSTPKGPMKWTGTGWVKPDEPTKVQTQSEAEKLAPGTRYQTPDGKVYVR
jgi:hypothetical protein